MNSDSTPTLYLDIGSQFGYNALIFGKEAREILAIDLQFPKSCVLKDSSKASLVIADAQFLPFKEKLFDLVSLFSVIEHITNQELALKEAWRVLKSRGKLIIQIPNKFFPLELHSGLPFVFLLPLRIKGFVLRRIGYQWLTRINTPSEKELKRVCTHIIPNAKIVAKKLIYPHILVPPKLRPLYAILQKTFIFNFIPLGFLFIVKPT